MYGDQHITVNQMDMDLDEMDKEFEAELQDDAEIRDEDVESGGDELSR